MPRKNRLAPAAKFAEWRRVHPQRYAQMQYAHRRVNIAIKNGELVRPTSCEACGEAAVPIDAAHHDYSQLFAVRWLCRSCHTRWDVKTPKTSDDWIKPPRRRRSPPLATHCRRGHELTSKNLLIVQGTDKRVCRPCRRQTQLPYDRRRAARVLGVNVEDIAPTEQVAAA